jgi:hypothetical protein
MSWIQVNTLAVAQLSHTARTEHIRSVHEMEHNLNKEHGCSVKEIHVHLVANKVTIVSLRKLGNPKETSKDDYGGREKKQFEQLRPVVFAVLWNAVHLGRVPHTLPKNEGDDKEETEEEELDEEPKKHDIFALYE